MIHKQDSAERINSMSDLLLTILIYASVMVVEVANSDNSVFDRDIQSFSEGGD